MELFDSVKYIESGREIIATVLEIRHVDHHDGENGEPLLHLGFFAPVMGAAADGKPVPKKVVGTHDAWSLVQFRIDVAHASHSFSEEANKKGLKGIYAGGRWTEIVVAEPGTDLAVVDSSDTGDSSTDNGKDPEGTIQ